MNIEHYFKSTAHDLPALFENTAKFSQFCSKLAKQAELDTDRYDRDKYVGDGMEFFVELFLKLHPCDNRVGVYNYSPFDGEDTGVDGLGINILGERCAVQVKFRGNPKTFLTNNKDHIGNLIVSAHIHEGIDIDKENPKNFRHFVFTNAKGLHHYTDNTMYLNKVRCFGYNEFKSMLDNNMIFWATANKIVKEIVVS